MNKHKGRRRRTHASPDRLKKEAFNTIRTNIELCGMDVKTVAITSCIPNEGKTEIAMNTAMAFATAGKKVLLMDCDLRKSVLVARCKVPETSQSSLGLTSYLVGKTDIEDVIVHTKIEGFDMIFAGSFPPNPVDLLSGERFAQILKYAREKYDIIILDTPPAGAVIDPVIISHQCDGAILVISSNTIKKKFALQIKDHLQEAGCKILGAIINNVQQNERRHYYYYYYYSDDMKSKSSNYNYESRK